MEIIIITGMSGSGKSEAMNILEDLGYYCVDNLPPALISKFVSLSLQNKGDIEKIALGVDVRGFKKFKEMNEALDNLDETGVNYRILFLETRDEILVRRYKMSRRKHPLSEGDDLVEGINKEREILAELKEKSGFVIDTSDLKPVDLREKILALLEEESDGLMTITIVSFGFKHGLPLDADLVFDVRFLPNPYYIEELQNLTGNDKRVSDYVMKSDQSVQFFEKLKVFVEYLLPNYIDEGKNQLVIAVGCTGGQHRSVTITNFLYEELIKEYSNVHKKHRDAKVSK